MSGHSPDANPSAIRIENRILLAIFLVAWLVHALLAWPTIGGTGITWDEAFYYPTFVDVRIWLLTLFSDPLHAISNQGVKEGWASINELPPLLKFLTAPLTLIPVDGWARLGVVRMLPALLFPATSVLVYLSIRRFTGILPASVGAIAWYTHPVLAGHGQLASAETLVSFLVALLIYVALLQPDGRRAWLLLGLVAGLGVATKANGIITISALSTWLLIGHLLDQRQRSLHGFLPPAGRVKAALLIPIGAVAILFLLWPWFWHNVGQRPLEYWRFVVDHPAWGVWYQGELWNRGRPPVPPSYVFVMPFLVTPISLLLLFWLGVLGAAWRSICQRHVDRRRALIAAIFLSSLLAAAMPATPRYDSIRLFMPAFVAACIIGAVGLGDLLVLLRRRGIRSVWIPRGFLLIALLSLFSLPNIDYYNRLYRSTVRSESIFPMEATYWCNLINPTFARELPEHVPPGARIKTLALQVDALLLLQDWGVIDPNYSFTGAPPYDAHLMQNRKGFWSPTEWMFYAEKVPLATWGEAPNGEPLLILYDGRHPRDR